VGHLHGDACPRPDGGQGRFAAVRSASLAPSAHWRSMDRSSPGQHVSHATRQGCRSHCRNDVMRAEMTIECRSDPLIAMRTLIGYLRMFNARIAINGSPTRTARDSRDRRRCRSDCRTRHVPEITIECRSDPLIAMRTLIAYLRMFNARIRDPWIASTVERVLFSRRFDAEPKHLKRKRPPNPVMRFGGRYRDAFVRRPCSAPRRSSARCARRSAACRGRTGRRGSCGSRPVRRPAAARRRRSAGPGP
jgi:hypothetical protein